MRERIDVLRVEALGNRFQSTEQQIEVESRRCAIERISAPAGSTVVDPGRRRARGSDHRPG